MLLCSRTGVLIQPVLPCLGKVSSSSGSCWTTLSLLLPHGDEGNNNVDRALHSCWEMAPPCNMWARRAKQDQWWSPQSAKSPVITGHVCNRQSSLSWGQEVESACWDRVKHGHIYSIAWARAMAVDLSTSAASEQWGRGLLQSLHEFLLPPKLILPVACFKVGWLCHINTGTEHRQPDLQEGGAL